MSRRVYCKALYYLNVGTFFKDGQSYRADVLLTFQIHLLFRPVDKIPVKNVLWERDNACFSDRHGCSI